MHFPWRSTSEGRPGIRAVLTEGVALEMLQQAGLSQQDVQSFTEAIASLSYMRTARPDDVLGIYGGGWRSFTSLEKTYRYDYTSVALCLVLALRRSRRKLLALYDAPQGALIEAKLSFDFWSWPGRLRFGIFDQGESIRLVATSEINGQVFDWGKGRRALEHVFREAERLLKVLASMDQPT